MKNWKYIEGAKTGNETLAAHPDSAVAQEIYKIYLDNGKDENKALEVLASKYKNLPKEALKKHLKDAIKAYANIVRNSKAGNIAADITTDGNTWFVTTSDGKKKEFPSEREAESYVKKIKTGNDTPLEYAHRKPKAVNEDKTGAEEFFKQLSDDVKEREEKDDEEIKLVGNETYQHKLYPNKYVIIEGNNYKIVTDGKVEKSGKITDAVLYGINQTYKRVGNALNWDENLVGKFVWVKDKGQEWKVYVMQDKGDKVYIRDDDDGSQGWISKTRITGKVGNASVGNAKDKNGKELRIGDIVLVWTSAGERAGKVKAISGDRITVAIRNEGDWSTPGKLADKVSNSKAKNEASDDKFAYVMREFDEGKLKTPDGKVVTDPAQAKAIAYSESKKTENGLARARNAMACNGLLDTVLSKTKHITRFGIGSKVRAEGETGTVVKETVEVGPNGIPFGWVTVKFSDGKTRQYYDYDLKK